MYVTDVPVMDRLTDAELNRQEDMRARHQGTNVGVHRWAVNHAGHTYPTV